MTNWHFALSVFYCTCQFNLKSTYYTSLYIQNNVNEFNKSLKKTSETLRYNFWLTASSELSSSLALCCFPVTSGPNSIVPFNAYSIMIHSWKIQDKLKYRYNNSRILTFQMHLPVCETAILFFIFLDIH